MDAVTVSAVIGAGSALAGVFLSQILSMLQARVERKHKQQALLREKLEDLAEHLVQTSRWMEAWFHQAVANRTKSQKASDDPLRSSEEARRVYVLSLLYFPRLLPESQRVMTALNTLHFLSDEPKINNEKLVQAAKDFAAAKKALEELIAEEAKKLTRL
ncbi:hypothetical protein CBP51_16890 [Cellvibrio mixtus]|uniref:Uncharacterized protein n=1 Tax=Cellvibrio mixtus TaxID=39650 RepID=A0A266Q4N4_9GAMM|nr:hypothetical protein [Cellvibrio mixtus]OZY84837.1 hypothetical protein CBP51_16890 [Cellvibrio mixtus]